MDQKVDHRRTLIFLAFAFGISWSIGLIVYLKGGLIGIGSGIAAFLLISIAYMWAPALGNILTRLITREGWKDMGLRPRLKKSWPYWLAGWFLPAVMTLPGAVVFYAIFPQYFDPGLTFVQKQLSAAPAFAMLSPWAFAILQLVVGVLIAPLVNFLFTFGEEFGWRGYLLPKLMPLGGRKAMLLIGLIWGVWHWPLIFMGAEYEFAYPGYPWVGPLLFLWVTLGLGIFLGWLTLRSKSVWPAVIGHAAINGFAAASVLALTGNPNRLLGPLPVGIIGSLGFAVVAIALFVSPQALRE